MINTLKESAYYKPDDFGGVILFIDEMGKFLEAAVRSGFDIYIFQQLAEIASRSNGRLLVIGILHQSFDEYTHRLSHEAKDEWAKIQGRFVDLTVNATGEEQIELLSRAISSDYIPKEMEMVCYEVSKLADKSTDNFH